MTIIQVTYERLYNIGSYESLRLSAVASVDGGDVDAAWGEARAQVERECTLFLSDRQTTPPPAPASYVAPPASEAQRKFIATLQDKIGWSSEQLAVYVGEHDLDLATLTKSDASALIDGMQKLAREEGIVSWAQRVVTPARLSVD